MTRKGRPAYASPEISRPGEPQSEVRLEQLLKEARQEFLRSGEPMLDWDGIDREIAERQVAFSAGDHCLD